MYFFFFYLPSQESAMFTAACQELWSCYYFDRLINMIFGNFQMILSTCVFLTFSFQNKSIII